MKLFQPSAALFAAFSLIGFAQAGEEGESCCECDCACTEEAEVTDLVKEGDCDKGECDGGDAEEPTLLVKEGDCDKGGCDGGDAEEPTLGVARTH